MKFKHDLTEIMYRSIIIYKRKVG